MVVDGDLSGGPLIDIYHRDVWTPEAVGPRSELDPRVPRADAHFGFHGVHAQNYHIFTPPGTRTGRWPGAARSTRSCRTPTRRTVTISCREAGKLVLEFWITPFDYAGCDGPQRAIESQLSENKLIGLFSDNCDSMARFWPFVGGVVEGRDEKLQNHFPLSPGLNS